MSKKSLGKIVRVDSLTWDKLCEMREPKEKICALMRRIVSLPPKQNVESKKLKFALPSDIYPSIEDARGAAIVRAIKDKTKPPEEPKPIIEMVVDENQN